VNNILNNIYDVITEASLDVFEAINNYENKQQFIQDVHDNRMITKSFFNELIESNQSIFTEAATENVPAPVENEYRAYRFDFLNHTNSGANNNFRIAELIIGVFEASQKAKEAKGEPCNPLNDLLKHRTNMTQQIINKLYDGKCIAIGRLCKIIDKYSSSKSCFVRINRIAGYNVARKATGDVGNNFIHAEFSMKLPKRVLTKKEYEICKYIKKIKALKKEQNEIRKTNGTNDERFLSLAEEIAKMHENAPYSFNTKNETAVNKILNETCFTSKEQDKVLIDYNFSFHLNKKKDVDADVAKAIDYVNTKANQSSDFTANEANNKTQIIALGKQFGFC
jgi:hypothetical protein